MSKIKIVFLIPTLMHGGAEKVLVNLVNNLDGSKYDVTLFSIFNEGVNRDFLNPTVKYKYKFDRIFRGNTYFFNLFSPEFLYKWLIKDHYDIVVSYLEGPATRIAAGSNSEDARKVAWVHIELNDEKNAAIGFRNIKEAKKYYESFHQVVGVSEVVLDCFKKIISATVPSRVVYNTNETELIKQMALESPDHVFNKEVVNLVSVAKIVKTKGYDRLIDAHKRLLDEGFPHVINILGIGEEKESLEKKVKDLGVEHSFRFLGFHKNPYQYIGRSDLYICSSLREGFSTAVSEALILGVPVVSTNCSGAEEMLGKNNEYGIVTENTTEGIYRGLKQMLSDPETLEHYRRKAEIRGGFFSKEKTVKEVEQLFDSLL